METLQQRCSYFECSAFFDPRASGCYDEQAVKHDCSPGCRSMAAFDEVTFYSELQERGIAYLVIKQQMIPLDGRKAIQRR